MHEDYLTNAGFSIDNTINVQPEEKDFNSIFDNLTDEVANVSKYISEVNKKLQPYARITHIVILDEPLEMTTTKKVKRVYNKNIGFN